MERIQDEKFEKIKREAIHAVNTDSVFLKPKAISHATRRESQEEEEEKKEDGLNQDHGQEPSESKPKEAQFWGGMSEILQGEARPRLRIDSYEIQQRKVLEEKKKNAQEFECVEDDGKFSMSSLIAIEVKSAKKKKRR